MKLRALRVLALIVLACTASACSVNVVVAPHANLSVSRDDVGINQLPAFDGYVEMSDIPAE